jgi:hypothetical protein
MGLPLCRQSDTACSDSHYRRSKMSAVPHTPDTRRELLPLEPSLATLGCQMATALPCTAADGQACQYAVTCYVVSLPYRQPHQAAITKVIHMQPAAGTSASSCIPAAADDGVLGCYHQHPPARSQFSGRRLPQTLRSAKRSATPYRQDPHVCHLTGTAAYRTFTDSGSASANSAPCQLGQGSGMIRRDCDLSNTQLLQSLP